MRLQTSIDFVKADVDKHKLLISSERPLDVLSSAVHNGGFKKVNNIISIHVPEDNDDNCNRNIDDLDKELHENPENILKRAIVKLGNDPDEVVGMMTHADVRNVEVSHRRLQDITLSAFVTAGVEVAATAGELTISKPGSSNIDPVGTINVILLVDGNLTESCMVDAVKTVIEAKTVALRELDIRSYFSGDPASGTVTDSVVVACTKRGAPVKYAGTATVLGELIGESVKDSLKKTLYNEQQVVADRCLTKRLDERKISLENAMNLFLVTHPNLTENFEHFKEKVQHALSNPKIVPLVVAGIRLDDDLKVGLIPSMFDKSMVIEIFQVNIAKCLCNKKQSATLKLEDIPLDAIKNLGPFIRRILWAIMSCVYSNICN
ncbi:adenosylcobinamide amidohydrolase [Thermoproteota archaeon]